MTEHFEGVKIKGSFRLQIVDPDGTITGDSGWRTNQITNLGFNQYLVSALGGIAGSKQISHAAIGTGGVPATGDTTLSGEQSARAAVTAATSNTSKALQLTFTFASSASFVTDTKNISNIGLFNSVSGGTLFAGNTFASSSCATNQAVNGTYVISFS